MGLEPAPFREVNGVIYFSVTSDGTTGPQWIERLKKKGFSLGVWDRSLLQSDDFKPTSGATTEVVVLNGRLWRYCKRTTENIRAEASRRNLVKPNAEVACLIREKFTDREIKEMGFQYVVVMCEQIKDYFGLPCLPGLVRDSIDLVDTCTVVTSFDAFFDDRSDDSWYRGAGFAFATSPA